MADAAELTTYRLEREGATRLLFLLHGYSAEQHHLAAYVPLVDPEERFTAICPRGPHDVDDGDGDGASWFPIGATRDRAQIEQATERLRSFIAAEAEAARVELERCVIGGFSQGGLLSLTLAGSGDGHRYGGLWAMCCRLPDTELALDFTPGGRPALVQFGRRDPLIAPADTERAAAALDKAGWRVTNRGYDMAHSQTLEMMSDARHWLRGVLDG